MIPIKDNNGLSILFVRMPYGKIRYNIALLGIKKNFIRFCSLVFQGCC